MKRLFLGSILAASLAIVLAACGGGETETIVVKEEVIREVPVEVVVEKEVIKEVMVPGETVVVKEEVIKEVQVAGETVVVTKEVPVEVVKEVVKAGRSRKGGRDSGRDLRDDQEEAPPDRGP